MTTDYGDELDKLFNEIFIKELHPIIKSIWLVVVTVIKLVNSLWQVLLKQLVDILNLL